MDKELYDLPPAFFAAKPAAVSLLDRLGFPARLLGERWRKPHWRKDFLSTGAQLLSLHFAKSPCKWHFAGSRSKHRNSKRDVEVHRRERRRTRGPGCGGVGLYLVKMAVDLHGGGIEVKSKEGNGTRFMVRLPLKRAAPIKEWPIGAAPVATADAPSIAFRSESMP